MDLDYLTHIAGFYSRHKNTFPTEYSFYNDELEGWQEYFKNKRENDETIYGSDVNDLVGLVKSAKSKLDAIVSQSADAPDHQ